MDYLTPMRGQQGTGRIRLDGSLRDSTRWNKEQKSEGRKVIGELHLLNLPSCLLNLE